MYPLPSVTNPAEMQQLPQTKLGSSSAAEVMQIFRYRKDRGVNESKTVTANLDNVYNIYGV